MMDYWWKIRKHPLYPLIPFCAILLIFTFAAHDQGWKEEFEAGQKAAEAPKMEWKLVTVETMNIMNEPNKNITTGAEKFKDFEK